MQVDLIGRINNTALLSQTESPTYSIRQLADPLFEATRNSIYTIKDVEDSAWGTEIPNRHSDIYIGRVNRQIEYEVGTRDTRPIKNFILYDITKKISEFAEDAKLITAPDNMGYFGYNESLTTYVEIISFDKLITDAKKRNQILFEKLVLLKK